MTIIDLTQGTSGCDLIDRGTFCNTSYPLSDIQLDQMDDRIPVQRVSTCPVCERAMTTAAEAAANARTERLDAIHG